MATQTLKQTLGITSLLAISIGASLALASTEANSQDALDCDKAGSSECQDEGTSLPSNGDPDVWTGESQQVCTRRYSAIPVLNAATGAYEGNQCVARRLVPQCEANTLPAKNLFGSLLSDIQCVPEWIVKDALAKADQPESPPPPVAALPCPAGKEQRQVEVIDQRTGERRTELRCRDSQTGPVIGSGPSSEPPRERPGERPADSVTDNRKNKFGLTKEGEKNLDRCVHAVLYGPHAKKVRIGDYDFNCKPPDRWTQIGNVWEFEARLSHHRPRGAADDQIDYRFTVARDGAIDDFDVNIYLSATARKYINPAAYYIWRHKLKYWEPQEVDKLLSEDFEGTWEDMAGLIMATTATRLSSSFSNSQEPIPAGSTNQYDYVDLRGSDMRKIDLRGRHATPAMCQRQCSLENGCKAWTFHKPNKSIKDATCWLKDSVPEPTIRYGTLSGLRTER